MKFQRHLGLDIGSAFIKAVQLESTAPGKFKLLEAAVVTTPVSETTQERQGLINDAIKQLLKDGGFNCKDVTISLPEAQVDTRVVEMPYLEAGDLAAAIKWQAEQYISLPLSDVVLRHQVIATPAINSPDSKMEVLLVAAPNSVVNEYMGLAAGAGLEVIGIETEAFSVARSIVGFEENSPITLLVHIGAQATSLLVLKNGDFMFVHTIGTGGVAMSRAVATELGLELAQAEEYKKTYGLDPSKLEGKILASLRPIVDMTISEMQKALAFYDSHHVNTADQVKRVVFSGGGALLPGLVQYISDKFGQEIQIANPFSGILLTDVQKTNLLEHASLYTTAVGLAQKQL